MAQITIIGLGGIGGSLALALTRYMQQTEGKAQAFTLVGYDPDMDSQQAGLRKNYGFERIASDVASAVREANMVIVAQPTVRVRGTLAAIAPHLAAGATVTDTAAGKRLVLGWAGELLPAGISFIGGHPLPHHVPAPSVTSDEVEDEPASADLFTGAPYCIMPLASAPESAVNSVIGLAEAIGAKPYFTDPLEHDSFQAAIHDLPMLMSYVLMQVVGSSPSWRDMNPLAGAAFRDATRMASSDPLAVRADLLANRDNLVGWLDRYATALFELRDLIAEASLAEADQGAAKELGEKLIAGRNARTGWLNPRATLTPAERAAQEQQREQFAGGAGASVLRNMFGGFIADRLPGRDRGNK
jgi:prephenate dehydrogenase